MNLQPKKRKYRLSFRNKTSQYLSMLPTDKRLRKLQDSQYFKKGTPALILTEEKDNLIVNQQVSEKSANITSFFLGGAPFTYRVSKIQVVNKNLTFEFDALTSEKKSDNHQKVNRETVASSENKTFLQLLQVPSQPIPLNLQTFNSKSLLPKYKIRTIWAKSGDLPSSDLEPLLASQLSRPRMNATLDKIRFGTSGIYFCHSGTVSAKFLETTRLAVARKLKKAGRFWIRICADTPVTARSAETRMGRGKGAISHYEGKIRPGQMFLEFSGISKEMVGSIFQELAKKTPITIKLVT